MSMKIGSFRDLIIYQKVLDVALTFL